MRDKRAGNVSPAPPSRSAAEWGAAAGLRPRCNALTRGLAADGAHGAARHVMSPEGPETCYLGPKDKRFGQEVSGWRRSFVGADSPRRDFFVFESCQFSKNIAARGVRSHGRPPSLGAPSRRCP